MAAPGVGLFVPTTNVWDVSEIYQTDVTSPEFKELLVRMYQNLNLMSLALNIKDSGYYDTSNFVNGQIFFPSTTLNSTTAAVPTFRQVNRLVVNFGALTNTATKNVAHGLAPTTSWTFTRIYGCASDTTAFAYLPLPFASPTDADNIELRVDATNVTIITGSNRSSFNVCYVILEYLTL